MKTFKKVMALTLSAAMALSMSTSVFASDPDPDPSSTPSSSSSTSAATGNVLAFSTDTILVPTTLKLAINPEGLTITKGYKKTADESMSSTKTYYTLSGTTYTKVASTVTSFAENTDYYEKVTTTDQIVSLNYGIASKATTAKKVKISLAATYNASTDENAVPVEFVNSANEANAYSATDNKIGAKPGEMKMYLAVASANTKTNALAVDEHYTKVLATTPTTGTKYYTLSGTTYSEATLTDNKFTEGTVYYVKSTAVDIGINADLLDDVTMTAATVGKTAFVKNDTDTKAVVNYALPKATYALKAGEDVDFSTTQAALANKLEMTVVGGSTAFTLTGALNSGADWTKADASAITITPTFDLTEDTTGYEASLSTSSETTAQIGAAVAAAADGDAGAYKYTITGLRTDKEEFLDVADIVGNGVKDGAVVGYNYFSKVSWNTENYDKGTFGTLIVGMPADEVTWFDEGTPFVVTFILTDGTTVSATITTPAS